MTEERPFNLIGDPDEADILLVCDHASNRLPPNLDVGLDPAMMGSHIAVDLGALEVVQELTANSSFAAATAQWSRLVVDLNRSPDDPAVIPETSDGIAIPGNDLDEEGRAERLDRFFHPHHDALEQLIGEMKPKLILWIHSFTDQMASDPGKARPWSIGVMYDQDERAGQRAIEILRDADDWQVGDQEPYSGQEYNAAFARHAEPSSIPYLGIEMRQDLVSDSVGHKIFGSRIANMAKQLVEELASDDMI